MTDANLRDRKASPRNLLTVAILLVAAFLVGFVWQYFEAREARNERDAVTAELTWEELGGMLASAVIQVHNGGYDNARQIMSEFFDGLQENLEGAPEASREEFRAIMERRDDVITALSRSEPAAERLLTRMYVRYRVVTAGPERGLPLPEPATGADTAGAIPGGAGGPSPDTAGG